MKPVRLPAAATLALPRWGLLALCLFYILPGLIGRDPWKNEDATGFGIMWTMAQGGWQDWLWPHVVGLPHPQEGPLAYWFGALVIQLLGWLTGPALAARIAAGMFFLIGTLALWNAAYRLGRRAEAQPLRLAFGGQPEPTDYGRTLADGALLIFLGCLGLFLHSHATSANALMVSLLCCALYAAVRFFENHSARGALLLGLVLGAMVLTRGWLLPLALYAGLLALGVALARRDAWRLVLMTLPLAVVIGAAWPLAATVLQPFHGSPVPAWMDWNLSHLHAPTRGALTYLLKDSLWFAWPAWPFAGWALYAWRKQGWPLHIALPAVFLAVGVLLALLDPHAEPGLLLPLLPPLAVLATFGLPTMKRSAINFVDWFSVMTMTLLAAALWYYWIAKQTGWPAAAARAVARQVPGFRSEMDWVAFIAAALVTAGWFWLVHWRISRRPSVLWRAVVLSSGGGILIWALLTTLFIAPINYSRSYADVARQIAEKLPPVKQCVDSNVGPAQRASFAYFGRVPFAEFDGARCDYLLLQDSPSKSPSSSAVLRDGSRWTLVWEGRRASDRSERFRLYKRD